MLEIIHSIIDILLVDQHSPYQWNHVELRCSAAVALWEPLLTRGTTSLCAQRAMCSGALIINTLFKKNDSESLWKAFIEREELVARKL